MKPLSDYSFIRGVCHGPWPDFNEERIRKELSYCSRLNINSIRFWLSQEEYEKNGDTYLNMIENFMELCNEYGISSMPILWNGNFITDFVEPNAEYYQNAFDYAKKVIDKFKDKPYLLMWDVINEPMCNDYMNKSPLEQKEERFEKLSKYVRKLCQIVRGIDKVNCITVGHEQVWHCKSSADLVDVISYHDYLSTRKDIENAILEAKKLGLQWNKPILNTETGCIGRANPYEIELELASKHNVGWYLFNLVSEGFWGDIHGIVYPDGTIRDPAVIAALFGFFRNKSENRIKANPNKEGHVYRAIAKVEEALKVEPTTLFMSKPKTSDEILDAVEYSINILESCELVAMWNPLSAQLEDFRRIPEETRDIYKIKKFAYEVVKALKESCYIV